MQDAATAAMKLIEPLGTPEFFDALYQECRSILDNDQCNIFYFGVNSNPVCLFTTATEVNMRSITRDCAREYVSRGYRNDPTIIAATTAMEQNEGIFTCHLRARDIFDRRYRQTFYSSARVSQKVSLVFRCQTGVYYINMYRNLEQDGFSDEQIFSISQASSLLCRLVAKHHTLTAPEDTFDRTDVSATASRHENLVRLIRRSLLTDESGLTEREAGICAAIACGMTSKRIALENGISINTVATHRKRAYSKLRVSSQAELFARFYSKVGRYAFINAPAAARGRAG